jgi:hypothetical protein
MPQFHVCISVDVEMTMHVMVEAPTVDEAEELVQLGVNECWGHPGRIAARYGDQSEREMGDITVMAIEDTHKNGA